MKKYTFILFVCVCFSFLSAQECLTLHVTPGSLKASMTPEQLSTVQELTLIGGMNENDFIVFREYMPQLEKLIMEEIELDGIPKKGFLGSRLNTLVLPQKQIFIGDSAFYNVFEIDLIVTGRFPIFKKDVFVNVNRCIEVGENNPYCKLAGDYIYSMDGTILHTTIHNFSHVSGIIKDGIEIIDRYAFENSFIPFGTMHIPSSVRLIREHAFDGVRAVHPVRSFQDDGGEGLEYTCHAIKPPLLEGDVFSHNNVGWAELWVPELSVDLYKQSPQWNEFGSIKAFIIPPEPPEGIAENEVSSLKISRQSESISLETEKQIYSLELINIDGSIVYQDEQPSTYVIPLTDKFVGLLKVMYVNGKKELLKLNF